MRKPIFVALALGLLTVAGSAAAQYPPPPPPPGGGYYPPAAPQRQHFGDQGQLVISNDADLSFLGHSTSDNGGSSWALKVEPAVDYFVIPNLSIGGVVLIEHTSVSPPSQPGVATNSSSTTTYGVGARIGYNIALADSLSFWPKLALIYGGSSYDPGGGQQGGSGSAFDVQVFAPLLLHPINHFFLGIGPFVQTDLTSSASNAGVSVQNPPKTTEYGLMFDLGGWMDF
ncbi:MAG: hypothetical protein ACRELB_00355 [Polyangiaceae bacterium]